MTDDLRAVEHWAGALLERLNGPERRKLMGTLARDIRRSQAQRIASQRNPDGSSFVPRKPKKDLRGKKGRIKSKMFTKLRTAKYFRTQTTMSGFTVGFAGRVGRIARVHQYGLNDRPAFGQADVRYDPRELLGFTQAELEAIRNAVIDHIRI
ncbi:phage virion morphogenesis protein [Pseudomonas baltica]|uniref:phage virion morphogenesis protein n=1 Tax=Pseudomonas baltica TaxID=2762576 RepID=UPI00289B17E7|nr:phage virion morphogenesis protein [Pseudomonas baltica]